MARESKSEPRSSQDRGTLIAVLLLLLIPFILQLPLVACPEVDSFYHLRHAAIYAERGPFYQEFPWHTQSIIGTLGADIWYGFHLLLLPFSLIPDPMLSLRIASSLWLAFLLLCVYGVLKKERLPGAAFCSILVIGCSAIETWRFLSLRPYLVSLGLGAMLLFFALRSNWRGVALCALGISWSHAAFFWLGPVVAVAALLAIGIGDRRWEGKTPLFAAVGAGLGLILRPDALDALKILKVQLFDLGAAMRENPFVLFGTEVKSAIAFGDAGELAIFLGFWLVTVVVAVSFGRGNWRTTPYRAGFLATTLLALGFAGLTFFSTHRGSEPWALFACMSIAYALGIGRGAEEEALPKPALAFGTVLALFAAVFLIGRSFYSGNVSINALGRNIYRLEDAMAWLKQNSQEGDIVFHAGWPLFGEVFFWNTKNRYITGMDPIFLYAKDRALFYKFTGIEVDKTIEQVAGAPPNKPREMEDTRLVLERDFKARFVLAGHEETPKFVAYLRSDPRYREVFNDEIAAVFELVRP